jgi:hypothetical protein
LYKFNSVTYELKKLLFFFKQIETTYPSLDLTKNETTNAFINTDSIVSKDNKLNDEG